MLKNIDFLWYRVQMNTSWMFKLVMGVFFFSEWNVYWCNCGNHWYTLDAGFSHITEISL